jgi:REP element-mobilizing transposase RayT
MARPLRIEFADALYHVTSRGNEQRPIFRSDRDRQAFLEFVGQAARRFGWSITAWVLMTNHYHLVVQTPEANLSRGMQWLNGRYAGWFNKHRRRSGHLFQGRFKAFLIDGETYFSEVLRYVILNPVRAKIVERPEDYRWSSFHVTTGRATSEWLDVDAALRPFGDDVTAARANYAAFVHAGIGSSDRLWDKVVHGMYLGGDAWLKKMRRMIETRPRSTDHPVKHRAAGRPRMNEVIAAVARVSCAETSRIVHGRGGPLRALAAWLGWNEGLTTLRSIAASLRLRSEGHISTLIRRCERAFGSDAQLLGYLDRALVLLRA